LPARKTCWPHRKKHWRLNATALPFTAIGPMQSSFCHARNKSNRQSARILADKLDNLARTGAQVVASGNPGCLLQIEMGLRARNLPMRLVHPIELLDEAYLKWDRGSGVVGRRSAVKGTVAGERAKLR
jgi:hypothetical protein